MREMENRQNKFLTAKEASQRLGIPLSTLYRLSRNGSIKSMHIGNRWYFPETEIDGYLSCNPFDKHFLTRINEPKERRSYPRVNCHIECNCSIDLPGKDAVLRGVIKNVSGGGLLLRDEYNVNKIQLEDPIKLEFSLDDNEETIIKVNGRVVRKVDFGCGIKFRNINKDCEDLVIKFVG